MASARQSVIDMTSGAIHPMILGFALPLIAGNLFQQLYNTVDCVIVGNCVGKEALAAIGSTSSLINTVIGFFMGLSAGGGVVVSQLFGRHDIARVRATIHTMVLCGILAGIAVSFIGVAAAPALLRLMATPDDVFPQSMAYVRVYFYGTAFVLLYNVCSGVLRALGDSWRPLYFLIASSLVNVALDLLFVLVLRWGITGVAVATVVSQLVAMLLVLAVMVRSRECYRLSLSELRVDRQALVRVLRQGVPGGLQMAVTAFSNVFVNGYINRFGSSAMAGWSSFNKIDQVSLLPIQSVSLAATTFVGQNFGAGKLARAREGVRTSFQLALLFVAMLICLFVFLPRPMVALFNRDESVLYYGAYFLRVCAPFYLFRMLNQIFAGALRGFGMAGTPTVVLLGSFVVFRQLYLFVSTRLTADFLPVSLAYPAGWFLCGILMSLCYAHAVRKYERGA